MKSQYQMRLAEITLQDFKNVRNGNIRLDDRHAGYSANILGLYGQNGSGKTALIDAVNLLSHVLRGIAVPSRYADYINVDADRAILSYRLTLTDSEGSCDIWYQFQLTREADDTDDASDDPVADTAYRSIITDEVLSFKCCNGESSIKKTVLIDTRTSGVLLPNKRIDELTGSAGLDLTDLLVHKKYARATSRSFIFSKELSDIYERGCTNALYLKILRHLRSYGDRELFTIGTDNAGEISLNILPIAFKYWDERGETFGKIRLLLDKKSIVPTAALETVRTIISNMNVVLEQLVPGLTISIRDLGPIVTKSGQVAEQIQLMSLKNGKEIPLRYESEGIKKIVSILQLLIVVYNHPSITVAIDELDDGIFEYLLGELLRIISEKGKGQLIFTSHNLRPLETINKRFVAFTTTNPDNRYIRIKNVKGNNNLRDFYYRDITLGEQKEELYKPTNNARIALAFREAGESFGS